MIWYGSLPRSGPSMPDQTSHDLAVVGAGIVGLACALAAARRGKRVVVIDRDAQANGASVRNFGFITVTGQERGAMWRRAMRSRNVWAEVAEQARVPVHHRGLLLTARRPESVAVMAAFAALVIRSSEDFATIAAGQVGELDIHVSTF